MTTSKIGHRPAPPGPLATASLASTEVAGSLEQRIGREVLSLRVRIGLTGDELAKSSGISTGMMSKIETGQISASLGTFEAIAGALNVPVASIFAGTETRRDCSFVKAGSGVRIDRSGTKARHQYDLICHSVAGPLVVEPYLITLAADAEPYTGPCCRDRPALPDRGRIAQLIFHRCPRFSLCRSKPTPIVATTSPGSGIG